MNLRLGEPWTHYPTAERTFIFSFIVWRAFVNFCSVFSTFWLFGWHFGFDIISSFCFWLVLVNSRLVYCSGHHYPKSRSFISINCVGGEGVCDLHQSISKVIWIDSVHFRSNCELHRCQSVHAGAATAWNNNKSATATRRDENSLKIDIAVKWLWRSAVAYPRVSPVTIYTRKWSFAVATLLSSPIYHFVYVRINYFVRHLWFMQHGWSHTVDWPSPLPPLPPRTPSTDSCTWNFTVCCAHLQLIWKINLSAIRVTQPLSVVLLCFFLVVLDTGTTQRKRGHTRGLACATDASISCGKISKQTQLYVVYSAIKWSS